MEDLQAAQAMKLISALRAQLNEMTTRLARVERKGATTRKSSVVSAMRFEAAALRRDIDEAQVLIDRLHRRYLNPSASPAPVTVGAARRIDRRTHPVPLRWGLQPATPGQADQ
ncbi:hypothetical protein [Mycobacterium sp.]|uniref:hypothetical protein n=1 Tax=Mycobacterium sp. TaxID=1785 RepID=UPI003C76B56C